MFRQVLVFVAVLCSVIFDVSTNAQIDLRALISNIGQELPEDVEDSGSRLPYQLININSGGDDKESTEQLNVDPDVFRNVLQTYISQIISSALTNPLEHILPGKNLIVNAFGRRTKRADLSANSIVDTALFFIRDFINKKDLNKMSIPDVNQNFEEKILGINTKGYLKTWNGFINGLSSIKRTGDFKMKGDIRKDNFTITGSLGFDNLIAYSKYEAKYAKMGPRGHIDVQIGNMAVNFTLSGKLEDLSKIHVYKCELKVQTLGDIKIKATGLGPINWVVSKIVTSQVNKLKSETIDEKVQGAIKEQLDKMGWVIPLDF